jgi:hypothetical protein
LKKNEKQQALPFLKDSLDDIQKIQPINDCINLKKGTLGAFVVNFLMKAGVEKKD